jgi:hypothetical protein
VNSAPHNISAVTDISANIFALLIFILIIMLAAQEHAPAVRSDAAPAVDIEKDLAGIERAPLSSDELFDLLYDRGEGVASVKIDLFDRGIDVIFGGRTEHFISVENAVPMLRQAGTRLPVGIYVFGHRFYRDVTGNLRGLGWSWREVSVPQALRDFRFGRRGQGWSAGFSDLIARPANRAQFRVELARLLQSSSTDENSTQGWQGWYGEGTSSGQRAETVIDKILRWSRAALDTIALLGGLVFVGWVEIRRN